MTILGFDLWPSDIKVHVLQWKVWPWTAEESLLHRGAPHLDGTDLVRQ